MGMLYKIVPFLVWFKRYSIQIGRAQVPSLAELYSAPVQALGYWAFLAGVGLTSVAAVFSRDIGVRIGCGLVALAVATLAFNVGLMLTHLFRPKTKPFTLQTPAVPNPA
jgi:hypothetical protein